MNETPKKWKAGQLIVAARKSLGLSQTDIANAVNASRATIAKAEHGPRSEGDWTVSADTLAKIAVASGADVPAVLDAAGYDSNVYSKHRMGIVDVTGLSQDDVRIVTALVHTIREVRNYGESSD